MPKNNWLLPYARLGLAGKSPIAPGTVGSLVALVLAPILFMPLPLMGRLLMLCFLFWSGMHAATHAAKILNQEDPKEVVIDELVGQWVTFLPFVHLGLWEYVLGFLFFRLFDITKLYPVCKGEELPNGLGIMTDDVLAGLYAMLCLGFFKWIF